MIFAMAMSMAFKSWLVMTSSESLLCTANIGPSPLQTPAPLSPLERRRLAAAVEELEARGATQVL